MKLINLLELNRMNTYLIKIFIFSVLISFSHTGFSQKKSLQHHLDTVINEHGIGAALIEYQRIKEEHPDDYDFSEQQLNLFGYKLLNENKNKEALAILELNLNLFPTSVNANDSYADALLKSDQKEEALKYFRKILELIPESDLKQETFFKNRAELQIKIIENFNRVNPPDLIYNAYYGWGPAGNWDVDNLIRFKDAEGINIHYQSFNFYNSPVPYFVHDKFKEDEVRPDVATSFMGGVYWEYIEKGEIKDIDELWEKNNWERLFPESISKLASYQGKKYFVPMAFQWNPVWYRKDIFEKLQLKPPHTWNELLVLCNKINEAGYIPFTISAKGWSPPVARWFTILNLRLNGADFHKEVLRGRIPFTDERIESVFKYWRQLFDHQAFADSSENNNWNNGVSDLATGKALMYNIGEWIFESQPVADQMENMDFFPIPVINEEISSAEIFHIYGGFEYSGRSDKAEKFLEFLASENSQRSNLQTLKYRTPSNAKLYSELSDLQKRQYDYIKNVDQLIPLFEFSTEPNFADAALNLFLEFWEKPENYKAVMQKLEDKRKEIFKINP